MSHSVQGITDQEKACIFQIRLNGHLPKRWADWFDGLDITMTATGDTLLTGPVPDQAALHGLLKKVRDAGMPLVSLNPIKREESSQTIDIS